ncbi:unnamed protein product [Rotaria sordida]|uniref:VWFA domain-containing protein n=3 Tax=Rotaria sordida TaxID=392033 RepID=A0A813SIR5_9BILA|nr:unnamed protein product [Rotaria sordida]CAF3982051.1 unnamed protein product [Rotaria sordida]
MYPHLQSRSFHEPAEKNMAGFEEFVRQYNINETFATKLRGLHGYEIVFICDDSGSMKTPIGSVSGSGRQQSTRWEELKKTVSIVVDLASTVDPDGVDLYFLNRKPLLHVHSSKELIPTFAIPPNGATPIVRVLRQVLHDKKQEIQKRKLLIVIATDGIPTDNNGQPNVPDFYQVLARERIPIDRVPVTIMACTDDQKCMSYLNDWDRAIPNLDVVDNYESEKEEILAIQGKSFPFSFGDYVVKILMGGVDSWFDMLDERKVSVDG